MTVEAPQLPPSTPSTETEAGVIEDARARQRRHRRIASVVVIAVIAVGALITGIGGGGSGAGGRAGGQPSGSGADGGAAHAKVSNAFPGAPQSNGYGVTSDACALATPNKYLPARSGCVGVTRAEIDGGSRPDLIIIYSQLSRRHPWWFAPGTLPPALAKDFAADQAYLEVVLPSGRSVRARIDGAQAADLLSVVRVNDDPGKELFIQTSQGAGYATAVAYGLYGGRLVPAGVTFGYSGDSASKAGFSCITKPPRVIQRHLDLIGPGIDGWWKETDTTYSWHGLRLVRTAARTFKRKGEPPAADSEIGRACTKGVT